jgi:hypothetical protein
MGRSTKGISKWATTTSAGYHHKDATDKGIVHVNSGIGSEPGVGILGAPLNSDPHGAGPRAVVKVTPSSARPAGDMPPGLLPANEALNPDQHGKGQR